MTIEQLEIRTARQAHALAHPARHRLLAALGDGEATVSQLSHRLATNKGNVAHHLGQLARAGLVRRGRTQTVRGGTEQYFVKVAERITFHGGSDRSVTQAMMQDLADQFGADRDALLHHRVVRLTAQQAAALRSHLDDVLHDLQPAPAKEQTYGVVVGVYRR